MDSSGEWYPVTIVQARYGGSYEGGSWLCFHAYPEQLRNKDYEGWDGSDVECCDWWDLNPLAALVGRGNSLTEAYDDMVSRFSGND